MKGLNFELQCQHKCCCNCDCNQLQSQCWNCQQCPAPHFENASLKVIKLFFCLRMRKNKYNWIFKKQNNNFKKQVLFVKNVNISQHGFRHFWPIPALQLHLRICCNCISNWRAVNITKTFFLQYSFISACFDIFQNVNAIAMNSFLYGCNCCNHFFFFCKFGTGDHCNK